MSGLHHQWRFARRAGRPHQRCRSVRPDDLRWRASGRVPGSDWVAVLTERELAEIVPDCEVGAIPPVPELSGVPVYADEAVRADETISFHAGSHAVSARVRRDAWEQAAGIQYGEFARPRR